MRYLVGKIVFVDLRCILWIKHIVWFEDVITIKRFFSLLKQITHYKYLEASVILYQTLKNIIVTVLFPVPLYALILLNMYKILI